MDDVLSPLIFAWNIPWWRHEMETLSALLALCNGNPFPLQTTRNAGFDVFFDVNLNKRLNTLLSCRWSGCTRDSTVMWVSFGYEDRPCTVYPKKYAHGFVVLCFVVVMQSFIINSHEVFIHIHQGCFAGTGAIVRLPQCQWSKPDGYGKISQYITTTKHSKAKTVCIFLGIYCIWIVIIKIGR